jgi:hypothetical protein
MKRHGTLPTAISTEQKRSTIARVPSYDLIATVPFVDRSNEQNFCVLASMTTRPERFRVKAVECSVAAQRAKNPETKQTYLELMRSWRELADEIERFEHGWLDRGEPVN